MEQEADLMLLRAAGKRFVHRGAVLRVYPAIHCLLWLLCLHHVPFEGCPSPNQ